MIRRRLLGALGLAAILSAAALGFSACSPKTQGSADQPKEIVFGILPAENQASMGPIWQPLLDDMSAQIGVRVTARYVSNYASLIEAMRFKQVQVGWFSALPALDAVQRSNGEVLGRIIDAGGDATYASVIIAKKGSGITLDKVLACGAKYSFGMADAQSTSGTLAPMAYLFTPKGIEPTKCFKTVRSSSHQANSAAVANGVLDVASNNTVGILFFKRENPKLADALDILWTSPPLPESSIVARKDLDPAIKEKMRQFFLTYGTGTGPIADRQREVLKKMAYGGFRPADDSYLDPIREMQASEALGEARHTGDPGKIAAAQAAYDKIHAAAEQKRAKEPNV
ncbi:phosphate/phosphite/phosphonate ABC transporter substrate-binding protein [Phenylobacterium sp.]|jgi:phosphonate transport system substrate-binding protein|uniref:phosphate/phosphite/phosphonate ABC transporter substrate-binding protein n=1 Tax=Phenylobacterium sp. TaxID=1871053 RepID=UPI002E351BE7|nr:phosphate/phosphite/phosphonate ABC transporter substrate-binding protein [Phenylobacterium sp.]HEX3366116.1 phosphate/phosphite/phosphonate ABC transporter substrate-binding protein [Phenylobacterium sp.]